MKKRNLLTMFAVGSVVRYALRKKRKKKAEEKKRGLDETIRAAGIPTQSGELDETRIENANMMAEGSQFGVNYYNKWKDENKSE